jgi:plastocyanin
VLRPALVITFAALLLGVAAPIQAQTAAASCQFILGFKTLHDLDPQDIGDCTDNQAFAANGDAQQHTTKGLMVWRKADNFTAFTNGYMTWINGPTGLVSRLNTARFPWESSAPIEAPSSPSASPSASPAPSATPSGPQPSALVTITDHGFQPETVTIVTGGSVTFVNKGNNTHSATTLAGNAPFPFDTGGLNQNQQASVRLGLPGAYNYTSQPDCISGNIPGFSCWGYKVFVQGPPVNF